MENEKPVENEKPAEPESGCKRCGKPKQPWQDFCGAGCCARYEAGDRPLEKKPDEVTS